jgi:hypothetical protein
VIVATTLSVALLMTFTVSECSLVSWISPLARSYATPERSLTTATVATILLVWSEDRGAAGRTGCAATLIDLAGTLGTDSISPRNRYGGKGFVFGGVACLPRSDPVAWLLDLDRDRVV